GVQTCALPIFTRQKIPAIDRRNDKALGALDASIMAAGVAKKATLPEREGRSDGEGRGGRGRGGRNPHREGVKQEAGGQPHRQRRGRNGAPAVERAAPVYDPMAGDRARSSVRAAPSAEPKPVGELRRRPRRRRPSNGGKGHAAQG